MGLVKRGMAHRSMAKEALLVAECLHIMPVLENGFIITGSRTYKDRARTLAYHYRAYNLTFSSDLECPELLPLLQQADEPLLSVDVHIRIGDVPDALDNPVSTGVMHQASADQFLLHMHNIAKYLVRNGNEIIVQSVAGADLNDVRVFLLGSAFGALLHQRHTLVLHAGAVHTEHGAVLFAGPSGIGKSTLLGEMLQRGYSMMVDDVCAVVLDEHKKPLVLPGYPRTRLWADSARKLNICTDNLTRTRPSLEKFERQLPDQFWNKSTTLRRIYLLSAHNENNLSVTPLPAIQTFNTVLLNTYRSIFLDGLEMRDQHFQLAAAVAASVGVSSIVRPSGSFQLSELADLIEADLAA